MDSHINKAEQEVSRVITYRYILALTILALLSIASYAGVDSVIKTQETNAEVMNKAGHRRWMSQRIALYARHLVDPQDSKVRASTRKQMLDHASRLETIHNWLVTGNHPFGIGHGMSKPLHSMYFDEPHQLDNKIRKFIAEARELAVAPEAELTHKNQRAHYIANAAETYLLDSIDSVVSQYQLESEEKIAALRTLETAALVLTLLSLVGVGVFIFRPLARQINEKTLQIERSEKKLQDITSTLGEGVFVADRERIITFANPEAERLLGWPAGELLGKDLHMVAHSDLPSSKIRPLSDCAVCNALASGDKLLMSEDDFSRKDGSALPVDITLRPIMEGSEVVGAVMAFHDITQHKESEQSLREARETAEAATLLKDKFVSIVAHDLRSPFNSIMGFLRILGDDKENPLSEKQRSILQRTITSGERLLRMIEELLNISRLSTGNITLSPKFFDARMVASIAINDLDLLAGEKGIEIINDVPQGVRLYADFDLFNEAISNLVSNAIKFCRRGDRITIFVPADARTTIAVKDTGVGINEDMLQSIFKHDVKTTTKGTAGEVGTGLGLPFSHDIMMAHGGSLTVHSKLAEGTVFYAALPETRPLALIVDDEEPNRVQIRHYLEGLDMDVIEAVDGLDALLILETKTPHLIISDNNMPRLDGMGMLQRIKNELKLDSVPVIMVTSDAGREARENAFRLGARDYLPRPLNPTDFLLRVKKYLG
jgi:PAS domain S-box-containing protein